NQFCLVFLTCLFLVNHWPLAAKTYIHNEKKFSIECPEDWTRLDPPELDLFLLAPQKNMNMSVLSAKMESPMTLEQVCQEALSYFSGLDANIQTVEVNLNGIPCNWILHVYSIQGIEAQILQLQYMIVKEDTQYIITFACTSDDFANDSLEFEKIASSFRLL